MKERLKLVKIRQQKKINKRGRKDKIRQRGKVQLQKGSADDKLSLIFLI